MIDEARDEHGNVLRVQRADVDLNVGDAGHVQLADDGLLNLGGIASGQAEERNAAYFGQIQRAAGRNGEYVVEGTAAPEPDEDAVAALNGGGRSAGRKVALKEVASEGMRFLSGRRGGSGGRGRGRRRGRGGACGFRSGKRRAERKHHDERGNKKTQHRHLPEGRKMAELKEVEKRADYSRPRPHTRGMSSHPSP